MKKVLWFVFVVFLLVGCFTTSDWTTEDLLARGYTQADFGESSYPTGEEKMNTVKRALANGIVYIGMQKIDLLIAIGGPHDINTSVGSWGKHAQYVYGYGSYDRIYIYLENDIVTSWQN
jgi:hypothetical protein